MSVSFDELNVENQRLENELKILLKSRESQIICLTPEDNNLVEELDNEYKQLLDENNSMENKELIYKMRSAQEVTHFQLLDIDSNQLSTNSSLINVNNIRSVGHNSRQKVVRAKRLSSKTSTFLTKKRVIPVKSKSSSRVKQDNEDSDECILIFKSGPISESEVESREQFKCTVNGCNQRFDNRPRLVSHQKDIHKEWFPFKCSVESCFSVFRFESKLNRHIKDVHNRSPLKCVINDCSHEFETTIRLMSHQKECHKDLFPFSCFVDSCDSIFRYKTELIRHLTDNNLVEELDNEYKQLLDENNSMENKELIYKMRSAQEVSNKKVLCY